MFKKLLLAGLLTALTVSQAQAGIRLGIGINLPIFAPFYPPPPRRVYVAPPPVVYVQPAPRPVYVQPAPSAVYYQPAPVYVPPPAPVVR